MADVLYTLTEVKEKTGISLPTLQKYKKLHQDRIPSVGEGRTQRYPAAALAVFAQLKTENLKKRGRPRKHVQDRRASSATVSEPSGDELLTLKQITERTGISYPTLARYAKTSLARLPHIGKGRKRRYRPEAVGVFRTLYEESRRGRRRKAQPSTPSPKNARRVVRASTGTSDLRSTIDQLKTLTKAQRDLERRVAKLQKEIQRPFKITLRRQ